MKERKRFLIPLFTQQLNTRGEKNETVTLLIPLVTQQLSTKRETKAAYGCRNVIDRFIVQPACVVLGIYEGYM